jgi:mRNA-degrading endonuclease RelE of RelBE toxin-antitoxin system
MDTEWKVSILPSARRELDKLSEAVRNEAIAEIISLGDDPFPQGHVELRRNPGMYRVRFYRKQYRIIYQVSEKQRKVIVVRVRLRPTAYIGF